MHQEPNFEGNFEIRCAGNACISIFVRSMNASEPKMLSFIGPVSILVWALCPVVMRSVADPGFRRGGGVRTFRMGVSYRNFRSGSKLLQGPGQINKQNKIADSRRGGGSDHPPPPPKKKPVSAHGATALRS